MLQLVLGGAGAGKTMYLYDRISEAAAQGKKCILLVPEQASFENEKQLYRRLGAKASLLTEALSFTRLCDLVFRKYGGLAGAHLDDTARLLLMSVALGEVSGALTVYQKNAGSAAFAAAMCETVSELKMAGADAEQLRSAARQAGSPIPTDSSATPAVHAPNPILAEKLVDLSMIYDAYQALVARGFDDPDDHIIRACRLLEGGDFFDDYNIFVDGFMAFMGAEWRLLERILSAKCEVTVALPCENLRQRETVGAFAAASQTANRLVEAAKRCGARVAKSILLETQPRYCSPALAFIAREYPSLPAPQFDGETQAVALRACEDFYDELETVAAQIAALTREGMRYREIAVIARSLDRYLAPLRMIFDRYSIPFFTDIRMDIEVHPLVNAVTCALEAVRGGFQSEHLLALSKSAACGMDSALAGLLENYCFIWSIEGRAWESDFVNNPDGMAEGFTVAQQEMLARVNEARASLMKPLLHLKKSLRDCDGREFAKGIYSYLQEIDAAENLQKMAAELSAGQSKAFLETAAQVWDALIELLDVFGGAQAQTRLPLARLIDLFQMGVATIRLGTLPQTIDQVLVGTADRIRPNAPRAVFVIGLNEGEFPLWGSAGGILSMTERELLCRQGIDLLRTAEQQALFEKYYVYFALTQASDKLFLSWPQRDTAGVGLAPSLVVSQLEELFAGHLPSFGGGSPLERADNEKTAFELLARLWGGQDEAFLVLRDYFAAHQPARLAELERLATEERYALRTAGGQALFAGNMRLSPSRIERYESCPFSYFCQSGLRLKARRRVEFNPLESGSLIHFVLEQMLKKHGGGGIAQMKTAALRQEVEVLVREHLLSRITDLEGMPERFKYLFGRLVGLLTRLLERLGKELAQSEFVPVAFELPIGSGQEVAPLTLQTPDGTQITVEGVVDRVDEMVRGGKRYIRVVDYKSGQKEFRLADICHGLNLQMLIYLFALCDAPAKENLSTLPAGVLYMPARDKVVAVGRDAPEEQVYKQQVKLWKMSGLLLDDITALTGMERELGGVFIPVKQGKDGSIDSAHSSIATLAQMGSIRRSIECSIVRLAEELHAGGIAACPIDSASGVSPCDWCDYHAVCGHEETGETRPFARLDKTAAMRELEGAKKDGG